MFYALARYNGILVPENIAAGSTLRIPGHERAARPKPAPASVKPAPGPRQPSASPALAGALRKQGLSALAKGNPAGAVALLTRAVAADPGNAVIAADLARARRVHEAVR